MEADIIRKHLLFDPFLQFVEENRPELNNASPSPKLTLAKEEYNKLTLFLLYQKQAINIKLLGEFDLSFELVPVKDTRDTS